MLWSRFPGTPIFVVAQMQAGNLGNLMFTVAIGGASGGCELLESDGDDVLRQDLGRQNHEERSVTP